MPFKCTCGKEYLYNRNLKRHVKEKHCQSEYWNCVINGCTSKFIRRSYLAKHLNIFHNYDRVTSRECAINATRGDVRVESQYYEDISEDDSILDLLAEADVMESQESVEDFISNVELQEFSSEEEVSDEVISGGKVDAANSVFEGETEAADKCDYSEEIYSENAENYPVDIDSVDPVDLDSVDPVDTNGTAGDSHESVHESEYDSDKSSVSDNSEKFGDNSGFSDYDMEEISLCGDIPDNVSENDDVIIDSDDDEGTVAIPNKTVLLETFVVTVRKRTRFINGGVTDISVSCEKEYYRDKE